MPDTFTPEEHERLTKIYESMTAFYIGLGRPPSEADLISWMATVSDEDKDFILDLKNAHGVESMDSYILNAMVQSGWFEMCSCKEHLNPLRRRKVPGEVVPTEPTQAELARIHEIFDDLTQYLAAFTSPPTMADHITWMNTHTEETRYFLIEMKGRFSDLADKIMFAAHTNSGWYDLGPNGPVVRHERRVDH
jgi:hypothetical protein